MISGKIHSMRTLFALALDTGQPIKRELLEIAVRNLGPIHDGVRQLEGAYVPPAFRIDPALIAAGKVEVLNLKKKGAKA
jgi:arginine utilization protein RocB